MVIHGLIGKGVGYLVMMAADILKMEGQVDVGKQTVDRVGKRLEILGFDFVFTLNLTDYELGVGKKSKGGNR